MEEYLSLLMQYYTNFKYKVVEYNAINNEIKDYCRKNKNKTLVEYYSLTLKTVDKSTYTNDAIQYLLDNKLKMFLIKGVNEKELSKLIESDLIDKDFVMLNTLKEKTVLDIKLVGLNELLEKKLKQVKKEIKSMTMLNLIQRREVLKLEIKDLQYNYYKYAKLTKDELSNMDLRQYRFKYEENIGLVEVRTKNRTYNDDFIMYLEGNFPDAIKYKIDSSKLLRSTSKKINRKELDKFKVENYQEYLYVSILRGLYNKKLKNKKCAKN